MLYSATFTFPIRPEDKLRLPNLTHLQIIGLWAGAIPPHKASLYQETIRAQRELLAAAQTRIAAVKLVEQARA
jgi:hypothetical protein